MSYLFSLFFSRKEEKGSQMLHYWNRLVKLVLAVRVEVCLFLISWLVK